MTTTEMSKSDRTAWMLLAVHVGATIFASLAFATILNGPPPDWLQTEPNATIYKIGWRVSGPTVVMLGVLAALIHSSGRLGRKVSMQAFVAGSLLSLGAELLGTSTGFPFGGYSYTSLLGYRILNLVPFPIPISWYFMLYCSLAMCGRLMSAPDDSSRTRWKFAFAGGAILTAWDVAMDPAMVVTAHWVWKEPGFFYGMPLTNWIGWLLTGTLVARLMLVFLTPTAIKKAVSPSHFPLVLYGVNGVMSVTICFVHGFTWAWSLGILAMALPIAAAVSRRPSYGVTHRLPVAAPPV
jgi:putative membrane protein